MVVLFCTGSSTANSLRIWEREGCELHAVGKAPQGLHPVLAWQPNGRHLYAAHPVGKHHRVALYETNGLEHGGFDIPQEGDSSFHSIALLTTTCSCSMTLQHTLFKNQQTLTEAYES